MHTIIPKTDIYGL